MSLFVNATSALRPSSVCFEKLFHLFSSNCLRFALSALLIFTLAWIILFNFVAPRYERDFYLLLGYRESAIAAQFPCPIHRGGPFEDYHIPDHAESGWSSLGEINEAIESSTGKRVSILQINEARSEKSVMTLQLKQLLRRWGHPGQVKVLAIYVYFERSMVVLDCKAESFAIAGAGYYSINASLFVPKLYENVHNYLSTGAKSMNLNSINLFFNITDPPLTDLLALLPDECSVPGFGSCNPERTTFAHVGSVVHHSYFEPDPDFLTLIKALGGMLEPTVAIFHSLTHFNVSEVHYCFRGQFELLSPGASRLLGLYRAVFELQELQPWQDLIIMVYPLSTFGYPTIDYNSTLNGSSWGRLSFWDEPFSVCGNYSTPFEGLHVVDLKFEDLDGPIVPIFPCYA